MLEKFMSMAEEKGEEKFPWDTIADLINKDVVKFESAKKDVKGKDGNMMESHAFKFEFPLNLEPLGQSMANEIWHFGDYYVAIGNEKEKFIVAVAQVVPKLV